MFIVLQILCLLPEIRAEKNTSCATCLKATLSKVVKCAYFFKSTGSNSLLGPKSSTDATSNEVMEADDDEVEQKLGLNLSLLFNLIYKAIYRR